ncbi:acyloxyacyl hydrolase [Paraglaciecola aquimarina]|uniref:Lipid A deacylase n=1 Tax=Paraglaciecola aquimarina TaxID=1235557 RepID=A0ABU3SZF2_9ALTE|nr:acyloxyacyl hydrolase [Paraglaciecola aquimarina]MDU0355387.1 acyloxyacyl hydrolase [Paraglaciecola aquimarina]
MQSSTQHVDSLSIHTFIFSKPAIFLTILLHVFLLSFQVVGAPLAHNKTQAMSAEYMTGTSDMHGIRLAYRPNYHTDLDIPVIGLTRLSWETSLNLFDLHGSAKNEATYGLSLSPIFSKSLPSISNQYPLTLKFGIGVAYVHEEKFGGVDIGSFYQFEDRIGLLMGLDEQQHSELALRYIHYSNGGFNTTNPGLDFLSIAYLRRF